MNKNILTWSVMASALLLSGCKLTDPTGPSVKVSECWSKGTNQTVSEIIDPNLKSGLQRALNVLGDNDSLAKNIAVHTTLYNRHPVGGNKIIGSVDCSASAKATITTPTHPSGIVLQTYGLNYSIFPGKNGTVIFASTGAFSDSVEAHINQIARMVRPQQQANPSPASSAEQSQPSLIPPVPPESDEHTSFQDLKSELTDVTHKIDLVYDDELNNLSPTKASELKASEIAWVIKKRGDCGTYNSDLSSHSKTALKCQLSESKSRLKYLQGVT